VRLLNPWALALLILLPSLVIALLYRRSRRPGVRRILPLVLRVLAVLCLILGVAGSQIIDPGSGMDVVFAVDVSDSIGPDGRTEARRFVERALSGASEGDRAAIVFAGRESAVERGLQEDLQELTTESVIDSSATSLGDAILRSVSLFDDLRERRIVLLSDGQETLGDAVDASRIAREAGVTVLTVPLTSVPAEGEVMVRSVDAPTNVRLDEAHEIRTVISASRAGEATVTILRDGEYFGEDRIRLAPGDNVITFQGAFSDEGVHRYTVSVESRGDPITVNNEAEAMVRVVGEPKILYVSDTTATPAITALRTQGISVDAILTDQVPPDLTELIPYDAIVFDNVPAYDLSVSGMQNIEKYVRDTGGGFVMIGGDTSFGAGGYFATPVEKTLPVDMDVTSAMKVPSLAMVFVIDKSGSMGSLEVNGLTKLDLVKEAVLASVEIMNEFYTVGLLAFDADFEWTVPLTLAGNRAQISEDLSRLSPGGGTVLEGALNEARSVLADTEAAVKHLIVLSDGLTNDADFEQIVTGLAEDSVTVSTVSIGSSADRELMKNIANWGGGRSYHTSDTSSVPRIFTSETTIVSRNLIVEEDFIPTVTAPSPILQGIDPDQIPPLRGFVLTYQKTGAQQILSGTGSNPVLSSWQYGLGRSVAFTSDVRARWATPWLRWAGFPQLMAQMVRWTQRPAGNTGLRVRFDPGTESTGILVDAVQPGGAFQNLLSLSALVEQPSGENLVVELHQTAPGRYETQIDSVQAGSYLVTIFGESTAPQTYGFSVPFGREYARFETDFEKLTDIAVAGGGTILNPDDTAVVFEPSLSGRTYRDSLWVYLVIAAIALLLLELLIKKIVLPVGTVVTTLRVHHEEPGPRTEGHRRRRESTVSYEDVRRQVAEAYRREPIDRPYGRWYEGGEHNPVAERKIHIARKRRD